MRRIATLILVIALLAITFTSCDNTLQNRSNAGLNIVCTIFPQYDWVRVILGDAFAEHDTTLLINSGVDFHSYEPTARDIMTVSSADLFIYVGGHSDGWVENALANAANPDMVVINLVEALGEAILMVEHHCDDDCDDDHGALDENELIEEEHVWASLINTKMLVSVIAEAIIGFDSANADKYRANVSEYNTQLDELHVRYREMADAANKDTLIFGDRFPFLYLTNDYGLKHYAAFLGCSATGGVSPGTIIQLSRLLDRYELEYIMILEDEGSRDVAQAIINATKDKTQQILVLDSGQSVTLAHIAQGTTYLSIMESNLEVLRKALG